MLRCFCSDFSNQSSIILNEEESHHLIVVLRARKGTEVEILNGNGSIAKGYISIPNKKGAQIEIMQVTTFDISSPKIALIHANLTNNNTDFVIKEVSAIGIHNIYVLQSERSESKIKNKFETKLKHWVKLSIEACKQSKNPFLPKINFLLNIYDIPIFKNTLNLFGDMDKSAKSLLTYLQAEKCFQNIVIAIGPEGDFSENEKIYLKENNFIGCNLGHNILRAETAAIYSISVINNYLSSIC